MDRGDAGWLNPRPETSAGPIDSDRCEPLRGKAALPRPASASIKSASIASIDWLRIGCARRARGGLASHGASDVVRIAGRPRWRDRRSSAPAPPARAPTRSASTNASKPRPGWVGEARACSRGSPRWGHGGGVSRGGASGSASSSAREASSSSRCAAASIWASTRRRLNRAVRGSPSSSRSSIAARSAIARSRASCAIAAESDSPNAAAPIDRGAAHSGKNGLPRRARRISACSDTRRRSRAMLDLSRRRAAAIDSIDSSSVASIACSSAMQWARSASPTGGASSQRAIAQRSTDSAAARSSESTSPAARRGGGRHAGEPSHAEKSAAAWRRVDSASRVESPATTADSTALPSRATASSPQPCQRSDDSSAWRIAMATSASDRATIASRRVGTAAAAVCGRTTSGSVGADGEANSVASSRVVIIVKRPRWSAAWRAPLAT